MHSNSVIGHLQSPRTLAMIDQRRCVGALQTEWCFAIQTDRPHMRRRLDLDWAGAPMCRVRGSSPTDSNGYTWVHPLRVDRSGPMNVFESHRRTVSHPFALPFSLSQNRVPARRVTP